jgi:hypothetical protein
MTLTKIWFGHFRLHASEVHVLWLSLADPTCSAGGTNRDSCKLQVRGLLSSLSCSIEKIHRKARYLHAANAHKIMKVDLLPFAK